MKPRMIDATKLFERFFEMRGTVDAWIVDMFMKTINTVPTINPPPNDPLTLDELRDMDGEPVWIVFIPDACGERLTMWSLVSVDKEDNLEIFLINSIGGSSSCEEVWSDIEAIYLRKPEKVKT